MNKTCRICKQALPNESYWKYKAPNTRYLINKSFIRYHTCKYCCLENIDPQVPETFLPILQENTEIEQERQQ